MERPPKGIYTHEFHAEAVKLIEDRPVGNASGEALVDTAKQFRQLGTSGSGKQLAEVGQRQRVPSAPELELVRTHKELADVKMERELLKKFATYFAKEPQ